MLITQLAVVFLAAFSSTKADDSLRDAYHAVQKRMVSDRIASSPVIYYSRPYVYGDGQPEDIGYGYQKNIGPEVAYNSASDGINYADLAREEFDDRAANALEKLLLDYIEESKGPHPRLNERLGNVKRSSVFRERDPDMIQRTIGESDWAQSSPFRERGKGLRSSEHGLRSSGNLRGLRRGGAFGEGSNPGPYSLPGSSQAQEEEDEYLNTIGALWEKYKEEQDPEQLTEEDLEDVLEYLGAKEMKKRPYGNSYSSGYDVFNSPIAWKRKAAPLTHHKRYEGGFDDRYPYRGLQKRFPIAKRSPSYYPIPMERKKKSEAKTDAKTAAELNNIFDTTSNSSTPANSEGTKPPDTKSGKSPPTQTPAGQKEQALVGTQAGKPLELKPLELKKKSINWSDYFGYDRKKKSSDWLVDQYLREYGLSPMAKRRPQHQPAQQDTEDVDSKIRDMEDSIVDEAVKFTGSHEGTKDAKEIQAVKDRVLSQLAAAYNLEKIRRAVVEFKASMAAQKMSSPSSHNIPSPTRVDDDYKSEGGHLVEDKKKKKTASTLPKIDKKHETNEIKSPYRVEDVEDLDDECPIIDDITDRCNYIAINTGNDRFLQVCGFHQLCSVCGVDQGVVTEKQCDRAFINETSDLCDGDPNCLRSARLQLHIVNNFPGPELDCNQNYNPCLYNILNSVFRRRR